LVPKPTFFTQIRDEASMLILLGWLGWQLNPTLCTFTNKGLHATGEKVTFSKEKV